MMIRVMIMMIIVMIMMIIVIIMMIVVIIMIIVVIMMMIIQGQHDYLMIADWPLESLESRATTHM